MRDSRNGNSQIPRTAKRSPRNPFPSIPPSQRNALNTGDATVREVEHVAGAADSVDVLYLTHNYPRHRGDFAGQFIARLAQQVTLKGLSVAVLAPHHPPCLDQDAGADALVRLVVVAEKLLPDFYLAEHPGVSAAEPR